MFQLGTCGGDVSRARSFAADAVLTIGVRGAIIAFGFLTSVLTARTLGPEGRGQFAVAIAIGSMAVQLCNFGLQTANPYYVARSPHLMTHLVRNSAVISVVIGAGTAVGLGVLFLLISPEMTPLPKLLLATALAWIPLGLGYMLLVNLMLGVHEVLAFNLIELTNKALMVLLLGCLGIVNRLSATSAMSVGVLVMAVSLVLVCFRLRRHAGPIWPCHFSYSLFRSTLTYGVKAQLVALSSFLLLRLGLLHSNYVLDPAEVGCYSIAVSVAEVLCFLPASLMSVLLPRLTAGAGEPSDWQLARNSAIFMGLLMAGIAAIIVLVAAPALEFAYGARFIPARGPLLILTAGIVFHAATASLTAYIGAVRLNWAVVACWGCACLFNAVLNTVLIPVLGASGAALASTVSYCAMFVVHWKLAASTASSVVAACSGGTRIPESR